MWWEWTIFAIVLVIVPFGVIGLKKLAFSKINSPTKEQERYACKKVVLYTAFFWLCDFFGMSFIIDNIAWRFAFGIMVVICIFANLAVQPVVGAKGFLSKLGLIGDFLCGVGFSIYLIYIIPNEDLRTVVLAIVAAVYGGLMTLVGVAWTIKKGDKDRKDDMQRIEQERQEEERRKYRPIFSIWGGSQYAYEMPNKVGQVCDIYAEQYENDEYCHKFGFYPFCIDNADHVEFFIVGIQFDDNLIPREKALIRKNEKKTICFSGSRFYHNKNSVGKVELIIEDLLGNRYNVNLRFETQNDGSNIAIVVKECDIIQ